MDRIHIKNRRCRLENLEEQHPNAFIIDVTSKGNYPWVKFSPFYPHGNIPIPFSEPKTALSVEGIWQGLKVFEDKQVDITKFQISSMKNIKRTVRKNGPIIGHQKGLNSKSVLSYREARLQIYIPSYRWVLDNCVKDLIEDLKNKLSDESIIFLDYQTNEDIFDLRSPLSHAALVKFYLNGEWPTF